MDPQNEKTPASERQKKSSYLETLINFSKALIGSGLPAVPLAFAQAGYAVGTVCFIGTYLFCTFCTHALIRAHNELCNKKKLESMTYQETVKYFFSEGPLYLRRYTTSAMLIFNVLMVICGFLNGCSDVIFISTNFKQVVDRVYPSAPDLHLRVYIAVVLGPIVLVNLIRSLKALVPISLAANAMFLSAVAITFSYFLHDIPPLSERSPSADISLLPQSVSNMFFNTSCVYLMLPLRNGMKRPEQYSNRWGILHVGYFFVCLLCTLYGLLGYLKYGEGTMASITANLPPNDPLVITISALNVVAVICSTPLDMYAVISITWEEFLDNGNKFQRPILVNSLMKIIMVVAVGGVAAAVPDLDIMNSIAGALGNYTLMAFFPCFMHFVTFYQPANPSQTRSVGLRSFLIADILTIIFSIIMLAYALIYNILQIINLYS